MLKNRIKRILALLLIPVLGCGSSPEKLYNSSKDKVVKIGLVTPTMRGACSGAFIDTQGTILTCAHCVMDRNIIKIFVKLENESVYQGTVIKVDVAHDLALISIPIGYYQPHFSLGNPVERGQQVLAFGSPLGLQHSVSVGWVENIVEKDKTYVIHGASILPGSSGGPLVDKHGRLVGVNEALILLNIFSVAPGYVIAIDVEEIAKFLGER